MRRGSGTINFMAPNENESIPRVTEAADVWASAMAPELLEICSSEEFNPVMAQGWRWKAPELMTTCLNEEEDSNPRTTKATDVWSLAMTVVEVRIASTILCYSQADINFAL